MSKIKCETCGHERAGRIGEVPVEIVSEVCGEVIYEHSELYPIRLWPGEAENMTNEALYLSPGEAETLADWLIDAAKDVRREEGEE